MVPLLMWLKKNKRLIKIVILLALLIGLLGGLYLLFSPKKPIEQLSTYRVTITGQIKHAGVYDVPAGTDLSQLLHIAGGVTTAADISQLDLNQILKPNHTYVIPSKPISSAQDSTSSMVMLPSEYNLQPPKQSDHTNILYVALPHTFILIQIFDNANSIVVTQLPFQMVSSPDTQTIMEDVQYGGISSLLQNIEALLKDKVDYYLLQDKAQFVTTMNAMGGISLEPLAAFTKKMQLATGPISIDGATIWEYNLFLNSAAEISPTANSLEKKQLLVSMLHQFKSNSTISKGNLLTTILANSSTNFNMDGILYVALQVLNTNHPRLEFTVFPGEIVKLAGKQYWKPSLMEFWKWEQGITNTPNQ